MADCEGVAYSLECVRAVVNAMRYDGLKTVEEIRARVIADGFSESEVDASIKRVAQNQANE